MLSEARDRVPEDLEASKGSTSVNLIRLSRRRVPGSLAANHMG